MIHNISLEDEDAQNFTWYYWFLCKLRQDINFRHESLLNFARYKSFKVVQLAKMYSKQSLLKYFIHFGLISNITIL